MREGVCCEQKPVNRLGGNKGARLSDKESQVSELTCAALVHNNARCPKHAQCARSVCWFDDLSADFNLCNEEDSDPDEYRHFLPITTAAPVMAAANSQPARQASLF